jgi:bifunctional DNase/RNase
MHLALLLLAAAPATEVEVVVRDVITTPDGSDVVLLAPPTEEIVLPIWVGSAEASAIRMKLMRQTPPRPMTHDLLDTMIRSLGGKVTRVFIDDLKRNTFLAKISVQQNGKTQEIDARPSDSIALALRCNAPIFTARQVLDEAGVTRESLDRKASDVRPPPAKPAPRLGPGGSGPPTKDQL